VTKELAQAETGHGVAAAQHDRQQPIGQRAADDPVAQEEDPCANPPTGAILGTAGNDVLRGTAGPDFIAAGDGKDVILGLGGDDLICAGLGSDKVITGNGNDVVAADDLGFFGDPGYLTQDLLEIARLTRNRDQAEATLGRTWYDRALAFASWRLQIVLGRLVPVLYALTKPAPGGSSSVQR
jgi:hypothetical protein